LRLRDEALFGNRTAACVLLFLQCYGEGHAQRIVKTFDFGLNMAMRQLNRLEGTGCWRAGAWATCACSVSMNATLRCAICGSCWKWNWLRYRKTISSNTFGRDNAPDRPTSPW
jgi:hypothetical protein